MTLITGKGLKVGNHFYSLLLSHSYNTLQTDSTMVFLNTLRISTGFLKESAVYTLKLFDASSLK